MSNTFVKITIEGFKSIESLKDFELKSLNVIIGANGAGKSNLISFFKLLQSVMDGSLQTYVQEQGGASDLVFNGRKATKKMHFEIHSPHQSYHLTLFPTSKDEFTMASQSFSLVDEDQGLWDLVDAGEYFEWLKSVCQCPLDPSDSDAVMPVPRHPWQVYHFHDASSSSPMRGYEIIEDDAYLRDNASNIGPFLLKLKNEYPADYAKIIASIRLVMPFFDDFFLNPRKKGNAEKVNLSWCQKDSDYPMQPYHLSDGSIRFICLATALLQPCPPAAIILDEPELGLHPGALVVLAELIQSASSRTQVIIVTQSPLLIDQFSVDDLIVVSRKEGASSFKRLNEEDFKVWLEDYTVGELWTKNIIAAGICYE